MVCKYLGISARQGELTTLAELDELLTDEDTQNITFATQAEYEAYLRLGK